MVSPSNSTSQTADNERRVGKMHMRGASTRFGKERPVVFKKGGRGFLCGWTWLIPTSLRIR